MASSRRAREDRRSMQVLLAAAGLTQALAMTAFWYLQRGKADEPLVVVYKEADCECCRLWMRHLVAHGFRVRVGATSEWDAVRTRFNVPPAMHACHTAVVQGVLVEGHAPARDLHRFLGSPHDGVTGLIVPACREAPPGMESVRPEAYTVFASRPLAKCLL